MRLQARIALITVAILFVIVVAGALESPGNVYHGGPLTYWLWERP